MTEYEIRETQLYTSNDVKEINLWYHTANMPVIRMLVGKGSAIEFTYTPNSAPIYTIGKSMSGNEIAGAIKLDYFNIDLDRDNIYFDIEIVSNEGHMIFINKCSFFSNEEQETGGHVFVARKFDTIIRP